MLYYNTYDYTVLYYSMCVMIWYTIIDYREPGVSSSNSMTGIALSRDGNVLAIYIYIYTYIVYMYIYTLYIYIYTYWYLVIYV